MSANNFLDPNGVRYLWEKIKNYVATHAGPAIDSLPWSKITDKPDLALKSDIVNVYEYKGSVPTYDDLPTEGLEVGDVYNVETDDMNYGWTGEEWDPLGGVVKIEAITNEEIDQITAETVR